MSHERRTNLTLSRSIAVALALAVTGAWAGLQARGVGGHAVAGFLLLSLSAVWVIQVHLVQRAAAQRA